MKSALAEPRARVDWGAHEALLRELCTAGQSAARIAAAIPGATRNAVLGRATRLGLQLDGNGRRGKRKLTPPAAKKVAAKATPAPTPPSPPKPVVAKAPAPKRAAGDKPWAPTPEATAKRFRCFSVPDGATTVALEDLRNPTESARGSCRWPYDCDEGVRYCGASTEAVFCPGHAQLAYAGMRAR